MDLASGPRVHVGISGWTYTPWRGVFYPKGLPKADELLYASRQFSTIEVNGSFYALQRPQSYAAWHRSTPHDFVFAIKGSRFITHMKRLLNVETALANFFASGLLCLAEKLGPVLWQLPPTLRFDEGSLRAFLELLPNDLRELESLARKHDSRLRGRVALERLTPNRRLRHVLEVRHESFLDPRYFDALREHGVASCIADTGGTYPVLDEPTSDFGYVRLHGAKELYVSGYDVRALRAWAARIERVKVGEVFVYFDNDVKVRAPFDARNLARLLAGERPLRSPSRLALVREEPRSVWPAWQGMHVAKRPRHGHSKKL